MRFQARLWREKLRRSSDTSFRARIPCEERVALFARFVQGVGAERASHAVFCERCRMDNVVNEPPAVVVPEVMVRIGRIGPDAEFHFVSVWVRFPQTHQGFEPGTHPARTSPLAIACGLHRHKTYVLVRLAVALI